MPEWLGPTLREFKQFMEGNKPVTDQIEKSLLDIEQALQRAWTNNRCLTCPIAELVALASATRVFYQESKKKRT